MEKKKNGREKQTQHTCGLGVSGEIVKAVSEAPEQTSGPVASFIKLCGKSTLNVCVCTNEVVGCQIWTGDLCTPPPQTSQAYSWPAQTGTQKLCSQ